MADGELTPTEPSSVPPQLRAEVEELLAHCRLANVRLTSLSAELNAAVPGPISSVDFEPTLEFATDLGGYVNRFRFLFTARGDDGEPVCTTDFTLVVDWAVDADYTPPSEAADFVSSTTGYFAAYPYARELFHSCTARLGVAPTVIGIINREQRVPTAISAGTRWLGADNSDDGDR